jgi:hypothetical protein
MTRSSRAAVLAGDFSIRRTAGTAFTEGHGARFQHYSIVYPAKRLGVLLPSNSDNTEGVSRQLVRLTIGDTVTPRDWEDYVPYDRASPSFR